MPKLEIRPFSDEHLDDAARLLAERHGRHSFAWAAEAGYKTMGTDWRVTNLLASRFWPRRGFRTTFLRLYRQVP